MKRWFCAVWLAAHGFNVMAAPMDGEKLHQLTMEYETPHLEWAETLSQGKLKVLFVISLSYSRLVVETAQRMALDFDAVTTGIRFPNLGITADDDGYFGQLYSGTSQTAKGEELLQKLDAKHDVIVIVHNDLDQFPSRVKLKILTQVKAGAGLILYGVRGQEKLKNIFTQPDPAGREDILALAGLAAKSLPLKTYTFGRGRIVTSPNGRMVDAPYQYYGLRWWADFENGEALVMRTLLWAAGRQPEVTVRIPALDQPLPLKAPVRELAVDVSSKTPGKLRLRLRDAFNTVLKTEALAFEGSQTLRYSLPALATGRYYLDVMAGNAKGVDNLGLFTLEVDSGVTAELTAASDAIKNFDPIEATLKLNKALPGGRAVVSLVDSPYERVWYRGETQLGESAQVSLEVKDYHMPTLAAFLKVEVYQGDTPLALADLPFFFPVYNQKPPTYWDYIWQLEPGGPDRLRAMAESDVLGYSGYAEPRAFLVKTYMLLNQRYGGHGLVGVGLVKGKAGEFVPHGIGPLPLKHLSEEDNNVLASMEGRYSLGHPNAETALRILVRASISHAGQGEAYEHSTLDKYPLAFYGLGNETGVAHAGGFGPEDGRAFVDMLKKDYGTIAKLNAEWGRDYTSFEAVSNMPMVEAANQKLYPEYMAHRRLVDKTALQRFDVITDEIRKADPFARCGCDGTWSPSNAGINPEEILSQTKVGYWQQYSRLPRAEVLRSLRPEIAGYLWGWILPDESYPEAPWFNMLIGCANHGAYFISGNGISGQIAADYRPSRPQMVVEMEKLRTGVAQLLATTPLEFHGLAIWESYNSTVAGLLGDPRLVTPLDSVMPLISFSYQNGINFDFIARHAMAEKLKKYKVLFLAGATSISEYEEQQMLAYVRNGGTIVADIHPGIMNDSFRFLPENRLAQLFGQMDSSANPVLAPVEIAVELNGKAINFSCPTANSAPGIAPFTIRPYGNGQAILLNFTLSSAMESADTARFNQFMLDMLGACGIAPTVQVTGLPPESIMRVRQGDGFKLVGLTNRRMATLGQDGGNLQLTFPAEGYIYEIGRGLADKSRQVEFTFAPPFKLFSLFARKQDAPALKLSGHTARPGVPLELDLGAFAPGRVLCLQIRDRDGRLIRPRNEAVTHEVFEVDPAQPKRPIYFAYNAPKGDYEVSLTDVVTGLSSRQRVELK